MPSIFRGLSLEVTIEERDGGSGKKIGADLQFPACQPRSPDLRCCYSLCKAFHESEQDNRGRMDLSKLFKFNNGSDCRWELQQIGSL